MMLEGEEISMKEVHHFNVISFRFDLIIMFFHYLWVGPVQTVVVTLLMYYEVRFPALANSFTL
jgi:hypothetical protein